MAVKPIIIFGNKDLAEMAKFYFIQAGRRVAGFTMDNPESDTYKKLPMYHFKDITTACPIQDHVMFAPIYGINTRKKIYNKIKELGYKFTNFIHDSAHIWHPKAIQGDNIFIQEFNNIQYGTTIGYNNIFWAGNHIGHHSKIGNHCYFTSHVTLSGHCIVGDSCWFGVNSTIKDATSIEQGSLIGAHSYVNKDITESWKTWIGTPASDYGSSLGRL